jgi:hypothetical protein
MAKVLTPDFSAKESKTASEQTSAAKVIMIDRTPPSLAKFRKAMAYQDTPEFKLWIGWRQAIADQRVQAWQRERERARSETLS